MKTPFKPGPVNNENLLKSSPCTICTKKKKQKKMIDSPFDLVCHKTTEQPQIQIDVECSCKMKSFFLNPIQAC